MDPLPRYDWRRSYDWNYAHAPDPVECDVPACKGKWEFCGLPVGSPLGLAAGPLLNGRWILYYASLGFDVLTYKTVRSAARQGYPLPNLQPVTSGTFAGGEAPLSVAARMQGSWAVSFGMPSQAPDVWRRDVANTRAKLPKDKVLNVSVVASPQPGWTRDDLAADFAQCARWAVDSGADTVEANFSCPNVETPDGQLYQDPESAGLVAAGLRAGVSNKPLLLKIGHLPEPERAKGLLSALAPHVDGLVMVNCIATQVRAGDGQLLFAGQRRGIAGAAIRQACLEQNRMFARSIREQALPLQLIGVGGIAEAADAEAFLAAGCNALQLATSAMLDPTVALRLRRAL